MSNKYLTIITVVLLTSTVLCGCSVHDAKEPSKLYWVPEESYFAGYEIVGDTVVFSYSICFVNDLDEDYAVVSVRGLKNQSCRAGLNMPTFIKALHRTTSSKGIQKRTSYTLLKESISVKR